MEIQWIIIAQAYRLNEDRTLNIGRIVHRFTIYGENRTASIYLLAKVYFNPAEAGESKIITLQVNHDKIGKLESFRMPYKVPNLITVVNRITYIAINLDKIEFQDAGTYTFTMLVDGEYKNEESIEVTYDKEATDA